MGKISKAVRGVADIYNGASLIVRIIVGLIIGTVLALTMPHVTWIGEFGTLFVAALKAAAPILVFVLVASALAQGTSKLDRRFGTVLFLYLFTTFLAAVVAVLTSRLFPQTLSLGKAAKADVVPQGLSEVIQTLLTNIVANPIQAIIDGNYICILMWACLFGLAMKSIANESSKAFMANVADAVSQVIRWVINLARSASWASCSPTWPTTACPHSPSTAACCSCSSAPCCSWCSCSARSSSSSSCAATRTRWSTAASRNPA